jgi:hypothetical protein
VSIKRHLIILLTLGYSVVEKLRFADTDTILVDSNIAIGYLMLLVVDSHLGIEPLNIDWQKFPADGKNDSQ